MWNDVKSRQSQRKVSTEVSAAAPSPDVANSRPQASLKDAAKARSKGIGGQDVWAEVFSETHAVSQ